MEYKEDDIYKTTQAFEPCQGWFENELCGSFTRIIVIMPKESQNWGKTVCVRCNKFFVWVRDPKKNTKRQAIKYIKQETTYCEICLRVRECLGIANTFTEHHILSPETNPELDNEISNRLKLCTQCHQIVETIRKMCRTGVYKNG